MWGRKEKVVNKDLSVVLEIQYMAIAQLLLEFNHMPTREATIERVLFIIEQKPEKQPRVVLKLVT